MWITINFFFEKNTKKRLVFTNEKSFSKSETIETTLAKILDKLAKFSKLNFLGVGCSLDELLERLFF